MSEREPRKEGVATWFNNARGFGFIKADGEEDTIFVHYSQVKTDGFKTLRQGDRVRFN